jgi:hypothetical protein
MDLGKVTKSELLETTHKLDTAAVAAFIFKKAQTTFIYTEKDGFTTKTRCKVKLKIYKKEGLHWGNFRIPYYVGYKTLEDESLTIESAFTYNLEDDKIVKSKVTGEGKFKELVNENWEVKSLTFPNLKAGSIIEFEYTLNSQNLSVLPDFQYQYDIPVDAAEYITEIPAFYLYKAMKRGYVEIDLKQKVQQTAQSFNSKVGLASVSKTIDYNQLVSNYKATNIPALKEENFVNNMNNYYGKLEQELQTIQYPEQTPKQIATTWEDVAKSIYEEKEFSEAIKTFDYFINDLKLLVGNIEDKEEKTKKIYNYVKSRMNWNGQYGYYPRRKLLLAYAEKTGNAAEINLMLVAMLKMGGLEANPVLISTRDNGKAFFPNRSVFNYVIASVTIGNQNIVLDATDKNAFFSILPVRDLNGSGRLIREDGSSAEINLMPEYNSEKSISLMATINEQGEISGKVRESHLKYNALIYKDKYLGLTNESQVERLEKRSPGLEIESFSVQDKEEITKPVIENYVFKSTNSVEEIGDKMFFSPMLFFTMITNPFKQEKREYPVDFIFPGQEKYNLNFTIPEGYTVESLPQSKALAMPDNLGNMKYNISTKDNQIQLFYTFDINKAVIEADYYEELKNFYKEIISKQTEKIVLKKI